MTNKASSSNCHTFYIIYEKDEDRFINNFFIRESDAINFCNRHLYRNYSYMKIEMPTDFRRLKFDGIDVAKVYKTR